MKKISKAMSLLLCLVMVFSVVPSSAFAGQTNTNSLTVASKSYAQLAPGVKETTVVSYDRNNDRVKYYVVEADVANYDTIAIKANYHDNDNTGNWGKATVLEQANAATAKRGYNVVASQNASYYNVSTGQPTGAFVMEGVNVNGNDTGNSSPFFAAMDDGTYMIGQAGTFSQYSDKVVEAIGGWQMLVWDGKIIATDNSQKYPRSTIGVKADGSVVTMLADGNQKPISAGLTYAEQAQLMLELGCVAAIELDGGGSATYASKYEGESEISVRNNCCDGSVRSVSNTFMIISTAVADGTFDHANLSTDYAYYAANSTVEINAMGVDKGGHNAEIPADITWSLSDDSFGTIESGVLQSNGKLGTVTASMLYEGSVVGSIDVTIVNPTSVAFSAAEVTIPYGKTSELAVTAMYNGAETYADASVYDISVSSGTMDGFMYTAPTDETIPNATITATYKYAADLVATTTAKFGKGSDILFDFEDYGNGEKAFDWGTYNDLVNSDYSGGYTNMYSNIGNYVAPGIQEEVRLVDSTEGKVHSGDYALEYTFDYRYNTEYCNWVYGYLYYWGEPITYLDTENNQMGTRLGMWMYIPEEAVGSCSRLAYTYKQADGTLNTAYLYFTYQYVQKGFSKLTSNKIPEAGWAYVSVDMSQISNTYVSSAYYKDADGNLTRAANTNYAPAFIQWIISSSATSAEKCTFYIDDITLDYSDAVDDRDAPKISNITYADEYMPDSVELNGQTATSSKVSFAAKVEEDTVHNPTGVDATTAAVYVDGQKVDSKYTATTNNTGIFATSVVLPNGTHDVTFEIADKQGNYVKQTKSVVVAAENSTYPSITVSGEKLNGTADIKCGEQYNIKINTDKAEAIDEFTTTIWLNSASTWALEHMTVAQGFEATYDLDEIACKATITVTNENSTIAGNTTLISIPVYNFYYTSPVGITAQQQWSYYGTAPQLTLSWDVQAGSVTYKDGYGTSTANYVAGFGKERIDERTELNSSIANLKAAGMEWHYHNEVSINDKAATCTEDGYTGRTVCSTCNSILNWGTTEKATGHDYKLVGEKFVCETCGDEYSLGTGLYVIGGNTYYAVAGVIQKGWQAVGEETEWYYFDPETKTAISDGEHKIGEITYVFKDGHTPGTWVQDENGRRYYYCDAYYKARQSGVVKWATIDGKTYGFQNTGYLFIGTNALGESAWGDARYYEFDQDGVLVGPCNGITWIDNKQAYYNCSNGDASGNYLTIIDDSYFCVQPTGKIITGLYYLTTSKTNNLLPVGYYDFGTDGKMTMLTGFKDGVYYKDGRQTANANLVKVEDDYYFINSKAGVRTGKIYITAKTSNGLVPTGYYDFDAATGKMIKSGIFEGAYYEDGVATEAGLFSFSGSYYYAGENGVLLTGTVAKEALEKLNGHSLIMDEYVFGTDYKLTLNGILDGYYYVNNVKTQKGIVEVDGALYFASSSGKIMKGSCWVSAGKTNGKLTQGYYLFDEDGKKTDLTGFDNDYYYVDGKMTGGANLIQLGEDYYFINSQAKVRTGKIYITAKTSNGLVPTAYYDFDATTGKMIKSGIFNGVYYVDGVATEAGLISFGGAYYYAGEDGVLLTGTVAKEALEKLNGHYLAMDEIVFGTDYKLTLNGILDGYYYVNNVKTQKGIVEVDGGLYYAGSSGKLKIGSTWVSSGNTNGKFVQGYYLFDANGKKLDLTGFDNGYYYVDGKMTGGVNLVQVGEDYYFINSAAQARTGRIYITTKTANTLVAPGYYNFDAITGKMIVE